MKEHALFASFPLGPRNGLKRLLLHIQPLSAAPFVISLATVFGVVAKGSLLKSLRLLQCPDVIKHCARHITVLLPDIHVDR